MNLFTKSCRTIMVAAMAAGKTANRVLVSRSEHLICEASGPDLITLLAKVKKVAGRTDFA